MTLRMNGVWRTRNIMQREREREREFTKQKGNAKKQKQTTSPVSERTHEHPSQTTNITAHSLPSQGNHRISFFMQKEQKGE